MATNHGLKSWVYVLVEFDPVDNSKRYCKPCQEDGIKFELRCGGRIGTGSRQNTTNIIRHMEYKHPVKAAEKKTAHEENVQLIASQKRKAQGDATMRQVKLKQMLTEGNKGVKWTTKDPRCEKYHKRVCEYIVGSNKPVNTLDDPFFVNLLHELCPHYPVPSRDYFMKTILPKTEEEIVTKIGNLAKECTSLTLTSDIWTAPHCNDAFIALTATMISKDFKRYTAVLRCKHFPEAHTGANVTDIINKMLNDLDIPKSKIFAIITDNATVMTNGIEDTGIYNFGCFLHTLHLVVTKSVYEQPGVESLLNKCKEIVRLYKKSSKEKNLFEQVEVDEQVDTSKYRLKQEVAIRWMSVQDMVKQLLKVKNRVICWLVESSVEKTITGEEWLKLEGLANLLQPLENLFKM